MNWIAVFVQAGELSSSVTLPRDSHSARMPLDRPCVLHEYRLLASMQVIFHCKVFPCARFMEHPGLLPYH